MRNLILGLGVVLMALASCQKEDDLPEAARLFRPVAKEGLVSEANWVSASWQNITGATSYTVQISRDTFRTIDATINIDTSYAVFNDLKWNQLYQVQVRANAQDSVKNSKYSNLGGIKTPKFPTIITAPTLDDVTDEAIRMKWVTNGEAVTSIKVLRASDSSEVKTVVLNSNDVTNRYKDVSGLQGATTYILFLYSGEKLRGWENYTTKAPLAGTLVDLRSVSDVPNVLFDTLSKIESGSIVILKRGANYTIPSSYTFTKSVTILTGSGFEGGPARLVLTGNFDASGNIDYIKFENIIIAKESANYFMNVGNVSKIGLLSFDNIKTEGVFDNSFIRLKTSGDEVTKLVINNSVIDSFGHAAKYPVLYANASSNAKFNDIEITNSTFNRLYYFIRQDGITSNSVVIDNCTFNDFVNQAGYFINYSTTFPATFQIKNTIFGKTSDPASSNWIKSSGNFSLSNCYYTTDCVFSANKIVDNATPPVSLYSGISAYAGASTDLFTSPSESNFKIKDANFKKEAGDPRWR